jgi:hypothetical protein
MPSANCVVSVRPGHNRLTDAAVFDNQGGCPKQASGIRNVFTLGAPGGRRRGLIRMHNPAPGSRIRSIRALDLGLAPMSDVWLSILTKC